MESEGKLYYGIKEVAELFGINASKLRFYEKEFPMLQPRKNRSGDRVYTQADLDLLRDILDLTQAKGYTLAGAREFLKSRDVNRQQNARYIAKLREIKSFLEKIRDDLNTPVDNAIDDSPV
ncbi:MULTISPECIES: MerR family transcriptional regulator [Spirosoma]|uniref:MerR family transcriptional regulator n=1 Tax=Spirosoma sordidisoli TaxID=2502893 RepID=A0A4Q2UM59_9BACT|nr:MULTISPECIES: MerR family transcriptional regulator [Spirosoma]RYC70336.1 MerR family transcriptional regulator [Spirosoma sordidisoli]